MREDITPLMKDGRPAFRAHHWDDSGRYSTNTFFTMAGARAWLAEKNKAA